MRDQEGQKCSSSLWAQDNVNSSPFHQAANQWPMAGVPLGASSGRDLMLRTPATPNQGALAFLMTEKQWSLQTTRQGTVPTSPWALDHHLGGSGLETAKALSLESDAKAG